MKDYATCAEAREEFSALLDGELDSDELDGLQRHIAQCSDCLRELDGLKKVSDAYETLPEVDAPDGLIDFGHDEPGANDIDFSDTGRIATRVSFKPVLMAFVVLAAMAVLSYLISLTGPKSEDTPPPLVQEAE